jgi:hypothetical protein
MTNTITRTTEAEALKYVLKYDNADDVAIEAGVGLFTASHKNLEDFVLEMSNAEQWNTGGGCLVTVLTLDCGHLVIMSDEALGIYEDENAFWEDEGENAKYLCWFSEVTND